MAIERSVAQYRMSLFVVVQPRLQEKEVVEGGTPFVYCLLEALKEMRIPFIELKESDRKRRIKIMEDIVNLGKVPLSNFSLR